MLKIAAGFLAGAVTATLSLLLFSGVLFYPAQKELIDKSRLVKLDMPINEVKEILADDGVTHKYGGGFPEWAKRSVPEDYSENHGLITFTTRKGFGPQLLLVYFDERNRVTFITSTDT